MALLTATPDIQRSPLGATENDAFVLAPNGLYPLWENNGLIITHRHGVLTSSVAQFGILDRIHIGTRPTSLAMRVPNMHLKALIYRWPTVSLASELGVYILLPGAKESFFSPRYTSRLGNIDNTVTVLPLNVAVTWHPKPWVALHATLTCMTILGDAPVKNEAVIGGFIATEFLAWKYHALSVHIGEIGMWNHDQWIVGGSYRFHYQWFDARFGYFMRHSPEGLQTNPMFQVGLLL